MFAASASRLRRPCSAEPCFRANRRRRSRPPASAGRRPAYARCRKGSDPRAGDTRSCRRFRSFHIADRSRTRTVGYTRGRARVVVGNRAQRRHRVEIGNPTCGLLRAGRQRILLEGKMARFAARTPQRIRPSLRAMATACVRLLAFNLLLILRKWVRTVLSETKRFSAIAALE